MPPREREETKAKAKARRAAQRRSPWTLRIAIAAVVLGALGVGAWAFAGCSGWDVREPFERNAPEVDEALAALDAGKLESAADFLEKYLSTGACTDGGIGLPDLVRQRPNGSLDLGLTLFAMAERFGQRFGDEDLSDGGSPAEAQQAELRSGQIDCALVVVKAIASDPSVPLDLRARAYYLTGNLEFLRKHYEEAVKLYDESIQLIPGIAADAAGDAVGRDAAWNRAIALRRIEDQKDAGQDANDASDDASNDAGEDAADGSDGDAGEPPDAGADGGSDGGDGQDGGAADAGQDGGEQPDGGEPPDGGSGSPPPKEEKPPPVEMREDNRILDQLEEAPTYQEQEAKARAGQRRGRSMEDK